MGSMPLLPDKPFLRGHFHQAAFFTAFGACAMLIAKGHAHSERVFTAAMIYSISLIAMFGISALYHRPRWLPHQRLWMRRLDHAAIFVLIAGTGTPIALLALPGMDGLKLLTLMWGAASFGILQSLFWTHAPRWLSFTLYIVCGWIAVSFFSELGAALGTTNLTFLTIGGVLYTIGAIIYALKKPNPSPKYFGYHEIFHAMVIIAAVCHFIVIDSLIV